MIRFRTPNVAALTYTQIYLNVNGVFKKAVAWINVSGTWKRANMYVKTTSGWKSS